MTLDAGELIDERYRVLRPIGEGGMGTVYLAENIRIERKVAIKVLHPHLAYMADVVVRFEREARAAARIGSPHIAEVIDLGILPSGERFVIMEYLEGESLGSRLKKRGRFQAQEIAPIAMQLLDGLAEVHAAGIVHRDLKPGNIFLTASKDAEVVKILDFGVSKFRTGLFSGPEAVTSDRDMLGTPSYMAPEHVRGEEVDARADLYSVGAMLYRCLSGYQPFIAENYLDLLLSIANKEPRPLEALAPDLDPAFTAIVRKAMAPTPEDRYQSAAEFRDAIAAWRGRIDRLLAEFLGLHHAASAKIVVSASPPPPPPAAAAENAPRERLVSKIIVEAEQLAPPTPDPVSRDLEPRPRLVGDDELNEQLDDFLEELEPVHDPRRGKTAHRAVAAVTPSSPDRSRWMIFACALAAGALVGIAAFYGARGTGARQAAVVSGSMAPAAMLPPPSTIASAAPAASFRLPAVDIVSTAASSTAAPKGGGLGSAQKHRN